MEKSADKFCLRWNDFENNVSSALREIREEKDFFDVTLSVGEQQVQAHKLILSCCSPFFKSVLKQNPHQHPLLYLKGVSYKDLLSVLNFMYHGEVNVAQDDLNSFLTVSEELQVKGLTQNNPEKNNSSDSHKPKKFASSDPRNVQKRPLPSDRKDKQLAKRARESPISTVSLDDELDEIQEVMPVKTEPSSSSTKIKGSAALNHSQRTDHLRIARVVGADQSGVIGDDDDDDHQASSMATAVVEMGDAYGQETFDEDYTGYSDVFSGHDMELDQNKDVVETYSYKTEFGKYCCRVCDHIARDKYNIRLHLEGRHSLSAGYTCPTCFSTFKTTQDFSKHKNRALCHVDSPFL